MNGGSGINDRYFVLINILYLNIWEKYVFAGGDKFLKIKSFVYIAEYMLCYAY